MRQAGSWKLDTLPQREQDLFALWRLEADMNNGGFLQFFGNWGEANCQIVLDALKKIDALQALASVTSRSKQARLHTRQGRNPVVLESANGLSLSPASSVCNAAMRERETCIAGHCGKLFFGLPFE